MRTLFAELPEIKRLMIMNNNNVIPIVAAAHDLSGFGRSSLTVVIPTLSSMGVQVCPVPTSLLSAHGFFEGHTFLDLTDELSAYLGHWKKMNIHFNCFYSGFLGSPSQVDIMKSFITQSNTDFCVIDPVFADHGKLYASFDDEIVKSMRNYIPYADIITPNTTEAAFLLGEPYKERLTEDEVRAQLKSLCAMGPHISILTSAHLVDGRRGVVAYDKPHDTFWCVWAEYLPADYSGTGDIFTSVLIGSLLAGDSLPMSIDRATQFVSLAIRTTYGYDISAKNGVLLERVLHTLSSAPLNYTYKIF